VYERIAIGEGPQPIIGRPLAIMRCFSTVFGT
jgi:hypothetical protein